MSESRVRENRMHGLRWRGLETERYATAPVPDPTKNRSCDLSTPCELGIQ
jgi:hypothetical protein